MINVTFQILVTTVCTTRSDIKKFYILPTVYFSLYIIYWLDFLNETSVFTV